MRKQSFIVAISGDFKRTIIDNRSRHATVIATVSRLLCGFWTASGRSDTWTIQYPDNSAIDAGESEFKAIRKVIRDYLEDEDEQDRLDQENEAGAYEKAYLRI